MENELNFDVIVNMAKSLNAKLKKVKEGKWLVTTPNGYVTEITQEGPDEEDWLYTAMVYEPDGGLCYNLALAHLVYDECDTYMVPRRVAELLDMVARQRI